MYKTYVQGNFVLDDNDQDNYASISSKPATDLKTMQSRLIQWVIHTDHTGKNGVLFC